MKQLTETQEKVFKFLIEFINENGYPPTRKEVSKHFNWKSANSAEEYLQKLAKAGKIEIQKNISRGIKIIC